MRHALRSPFFRFRAGIRGPISPMPAHGPASRGVFAMRFDIFLILDDTAMPVLAPDGVGSYETADCSGASFRQLFDRTWEAAVALLPHEVEDITYLNFAAERFPHHAFDRGKRTIVPHAWRRAFDAALPCHMGEPASAVRARLAGGPAAQAALERRWVTGAVERLVVATDIDQALALLKGVEALRHGQIPGTQSFMDYKGDQGVYDCWDYVVPWGATRPAGGLVLFKLEIREG
jgi:hypothetical protein